MRQQLQRLLASNTGAVLVVALGATYVLLLGWLMVSVRFDLWGAAVAAPVVGFIAIVFVRRFFRDDLSHLRRIALIGLVAKLCGTLTRYWVANDAYGGASDANNYHALGKSFAGGFWQGWVSFVGLVPHTRGTAFIGELTGFIYAFTGSSKLAGYLWFSLLGFLGVAFCVKAAAVAVPGLLQRRYAWLCFLLPSLVFWPSSIGKEAWMSLVLGATSMGVARFTNGDRSVRTLVWLGLGLLGASMVRPHFAGIWLAAFGLALVWSLLSGRRTRQHSGKRQNPLVVIGLVLIAVAGVAAMSKATTKYLLASGDDASVDDLVQLTTRRTEKGGSRFEAVSIASPTDYPWAIFRTLTRPVIWEVSNLATVLAGIEATLVLVLLVLNVRRLAATPRLMNRHPYVTFSLLVCCLGALAMSTFGNLAILVRQRSLLMPALLILVCLPTVKRPSSPPLSVEVSRTAVLDS